MSVSHPFLKQLKVHILRFCEHQGSVRDDHPSLLPFCRTLEDVIRDGLRGTRGTSQIRRTYWQWMAAFLKIFDTRTLTGAMQMSIEYAKDNKKTIYETGRGRLVLRCLLNKGLLTKCLRLLRQNPSFLYQYYEEVSILGDDILSELLLSLLGPLEAKAKFSLNLRNCSFLDETWELPWFRRYELVPCRRIGVQLRQVEGRIMITELEPGSVADEDMKIEPGDIVDDLFGESLRQGSIRKALNLMEDYAGSPVYISIIKCINRDGHFYRQLLSYLEAASLNKEALLSCRARRLRELRETGGDWEEDPPPTPTADGECVASKQLTESGLHKVKFWGYVNVGRTGTVEQIETGVLTVIKRDPAQKRDVLVELGETEVTVFCAQNDTVLLQHGYPEIASCGRRIDFPLNLAYIAGETTCTLAKTFSCFVFEAASDEQAKLVLKGIAEGFDRTHWAV